MRDLSHSDAISGNAIVPTDGGARPFVASRLDPLRHGTRRLSTQAHDSRGAGAGLRMDLPAPLLPHLHLAAASGGLACCPAVPRHVLSLQTFKSLLASTHQARSCAHRVVTSGGAHAIAACAVS